MTYREHLLTILAEECAEVAQRASKALRFGVDEIQPGQPYTNAARIKYEMIDLLCTYSLLTKEGVLPSLGILSGESSPALTEKRLKIEKFVDYARQLGTIQGATSADDRPTGADQYAG